MATAEQLGDYLDHTDERKVPVGEAREALRDLIDHSRVKREPVHLTRHGKPYAVLVDADLWDTVCEHAQDALDYEALAELPADYAQDTISAEDLAAELGIDTSRLPAQHP